jgi:hypothetical protein
VPAVLEIRTIADCRFHMSSRFWGSILGILVILWQTMPALKIVDLSIETLDAIVDIEHEGVQASQDFPHHRRQFIVGRRQDPWNEPPCPRGGHRDDDSAAE